jgi:threonine dehydratase
MDLTRNLAEDAGASPLAAALKIKERLKGKTVVLALTGGNISMERWKEILSSS